MLSVVLDFGDVVTQVDWHIKMPLNVKYAEVDCVTEVQADGDELDVVKSICQNIPMHNGRTVRWFGESAKFIVASILNFNWRD